MNAYDIEQVIQHFGSKTALARALKIDPHAVFQWKRVPARRALEIEKITKGKFTADLTAESDPQS